ncbi:hypothetical protein [Gordonia insulae]|uniref:Uncharacterized protein n=1 Tax=Gordonia insulae TaxID=2420509 RepID=A0A3G8JKT7_9ACTN|nr:hypothetical protein [Gordonia insulae]AZG45488.1 hypothetical protein D7316_02084 [Gordonia insulae]
MSLKIGSRLYSATCDAEVIVIAVSATDATVTCGGVPMASSATPSKVASSEAGGAVIGKRYESIDHGLELLVTKAGTGTLAVDGVPMTVKDPKRLPASD